MKTLQLKKNEERRLLAGHPWIFSNEVDVAATPLTGFQAGEIAVVRDSRGRPLGSAYVNPHSLICARLYAREPGIHLDAALIAERVRQAQALRGRLFERPYYRLVYSESDALPGLVVDRFGELLVGQITTAGMECRREEISAALRDALGPLPLVWRNDTAIRTLEGLEAYVEAPPGAPELVQIEENSCRFEVPVVSGQKTGWFFDHRLGRSRLPFYAREARVLDVFSYAGAWGIQAAAAGAREVLCVDSSQAALDQLHRNAALNGMEARVRSVRGDAFEVLAELAEAGERFDLVIVDPPAFIKRRKDVKAGISAYRRINRAALRLLGDGGVLITASCSFHLAADELRDLIRLEGNRAGRHLRILEQHRQGPDHPVHPAIPETDYLKTFIVHVGQA
jgi:23S rRNA (cytosine1962-C5)-methyltransferase